MDIARNILLGSIFSISLFAGTRHLPTTITNNPTSTVTPVIFTHGIDASKVHVGDPVTAKMLQVVLLPNGSEISKGTILIGHIVAARRFSFDPAPYAVQKASVLSIHFDKLVSKAATLNALLSVRALAGWSYTEDAMRPQHTDEHDNIGTMFLIGEDSYRADRTSVSTDDGDIVGYKRKDGVFARLLDAEYTSRYSHFACPGSGESEESVAIFSPSACGLYGMPDVYLTDNGLGKEIGTFSLESRKRTVKLYNESSALLQIVNTH